MSSRDDDIERRGRILRGMSSRDEYERAPGRLQQPAEGVPPPDPVTETIRVRFLQRQRIGFTRYGVGLGRADFTMDNWLQHLEEELMDALQYVVRLRMTLDGSLPVVGAKENIKVDVEHPQEEIARLTTEIADRHNRILALLGSPRRRVGIRPAVESTPTVFSREDCIFKFCPTRLTCEVQNTCVNPKTVPE